MFFSVLVQNSLGGTYGSVFALRPETESTLRPHTVALKVEAGVRHLPWELHILTKLRRRVLGGPEAGHLSPCSRKSLEVDLNELFIQPSSLALYRDACCLVLPRGVGTLYDVLKTSKSSGVGLPELSTAWYVSRMLRALEVLIGADILHADIKLDNWLLFSTTDLGESSSKDRFVESSSVKLPLRLALIDFGRSVDRRQYPAGSRFRFGESTLRTFGQDAKNLVCAAQWRESGAASSSHHA